MSRVAAACKRDVVVSLLVAVILGVLLASCIPLFGGADEQVNVFSNISNGLSQ